MEGRDCDVDENLLSAFNIYFYNASLFIFGFCRKFIFRMSVNLFVSFMSEFKHANI